MDVEVGSGAGWWQAVWRKDYYVESKGRSPRSKVQGGREGLLGERVCNLGEEATDGCPTYWGRGVLGGPGGAIN